MARRRRRLHSQSMPRTSAMSWLNVIIMSFVLVAVLVGSKQFSEKLGGFVESIGEDTAAPGAHEGAAEEVADEPAADPGEAGHSVGIQVDDIEPAPEAVGAKEQQLEAAAAPHADEHESGDSAADSQNEETGAEDSSADSESPKHE